MLRHLGVGTIVVRRDRGELAQSYLPGLTLADWADWLPYFKGERPPCTDLRRFSDLEIFIHEAMLTIGKSSREALERLVSQDAPSLKIRIRHFNNRDYPSASPSKNLSSRQPGLFHVGAGRLTFFGRPPDPFPIKDWALDRSLCFAERMRQHNEPVQLIAGPEQEKEWISGTLRHFCEHGGIVVKDLKDLAERILDAKFYLGFDSGPTHLAAQFGKPTIVLFGPTGPRPIIDCPDMSNEPVGPLVKAIAPEANVPPQERVQLKWLDPDAAVTRVCAGLAELFGRGSQTNQ
jgi:ADP-heptose:LPS heptosyltransferase